MKRMLCFTITLISLLNLGCEDALDNLTKFNINVKDNFTVESTTIIELPLAVNTPEVEVNNDEAYENNDSRRDLIESAKITKLNLTITSPEMANFDFLNEVTIYISAEGLDEVLVASLADIPETQLTELVLEVSEAELAAYLRQEKYTMSVRVVIDKTIESNYELQTDTDIFIDAEILGI